MKEIERDTFVFLFGTKVDRTYILDREPWLFNKSLLALMKLKEFDKGCENNFQFMSIWVHLYNSLLFAMTKKIVSMTGGKVRECLEVEYGVNGRCWGTFEKLEFA